MQIRSASDVVSRIAQDPQFEADVKANPSEAIAKVAMPLPLQNDNWIYRIVVISLGLVVLVTIIGQIILGIRTDKYLTEGIIALASAAVGALAGLLAPSPTRE
jgi:hypothetical protein